MAVTTEIPSIKLIALDLILLAVLVFTNVYYDSGFAFPDSPPPGSTGKPHCGRCHFDLPLNEPGGSLALGGLSGSFMPGEVYVLSLELTRKDMRIAGFQLTARFADGPGGQAGKLSPFDGRVTVINASGIQYAQHTLEGSGLTGGDSAVWRLSWEAPEKAPGPVALRVAANAGNGDDSPLGDHIYTLELFVTPYR
jgi:hypothetical protein